MFLLILAVIKFFAVYVVQSSSELVLYFICCFDMLTLNKTYPSLSLINSIYQEGNLHQKLCNKANVQPPSWLIQEQTSQWLILIPTFNILLHKYKNKSVKNQWIIQKRLGDIRSDKSDYSAISTDGLKDDDIVASAVFVFHQQLHFYCKRNYYVYSS